MFLKYADRKHLNVMAGDTVSVQGNRGIVTEVKHGKHNGINYVNVKVSFVNELKNTQYDNSWYGLFTVVD